MTEEPILVLFQVLSLLIVFACDLLNKDLLLVTLSKVRGEGATDG